MSHIYNKNKGVIISISSIILIFLKMTAPLLIYFLIKKTSKSCHNKSVEWETGHQQLGYKSCLSSFMQNAS